MKTLFASALIALTLSASSISFAADNKETAEKKSTFQSAVYPLINSMKIRVNINKENASRINISLKNKAGETLATERIGKGHESASLQFDLNQLQDGVYKVEISDGTTKQVKEVKLQTSAPTVEVERHIAMN